MQSQTPSRLRVLFAHALAVAAVMAAWAILQLWGLGKTPFHTKGEPREAVVVAEIVRTGNWALARRNAVELPAKPPLFHWIGAAASALAGGVSELTVRLPSALQSLSCALLLLLVGSSAYGPPSGLIAALALLTSFEWLRAATSARVDMTLAAGLTASFFALVQQRRAPRLAWIVALYAGIAWAILGKGPVGGALPALLVLALCLVDRSPRFFFELRPIRGLVCVALVVGAWYALAVIEGGSEFVHKQLLDENLYRFLGARSATGGHRHSIAYLAAMWALGFLPWTPFLPPLAAELWRERASLGARDPRLTALLWVVVVAGFYGIPASKRGVYLLPLYPAVCLLLGWWLPRLVRTRAPSSALSAILVPLGAALAVVAGGATLLGLAGLCGLPVGEVLIGFGSARARDDLEVASTVLGEHARNLLPLLGCVVIGALVTAWAARGARWGAVLLGLLLTMGAASVATRQVVLPAVGAEQTRQRFAEAVKARADDPADVFAYRHFDYGVVYYWGAPMPVYDGPLAGDAPRLLVMGEGDWKRLPATSRRLYERVAGLESGRSGNLGRLVLARRVAGGGERSVPAEG
jgi:4-amino-4-deoxy-L-arabinose transferase-like glycosyltransferase